MRRRLAVRLGTGLMILQGLLAPAFAQKGEEPYGTLISATFARYQMELPRLAWLIAPRTIIATEKAPALWIWSEAASLTRADYRGKVTPAELRDYRRSEGVACGTAAEHDRYELSKAADADHGEDQHDEPHGDPVLYTRKNGVHIIGDATISDASSDDLANAGRLFEIIDPSTRSKGFKVTAGEFVFTFAGFYDGESGDMYACGIVLSRRSGGRTIASHSWDVSPDTVCEGCEVPDYEDPLEDNFGLLNLVRVPHFAYPLLLEESGTDDEDALSLVTFSGAGDYAEYRVSESMDGCDRLVSPPAVVATLRRRTDRRQAVSRKSPPISPVTIFRNQNVVRSRADAPQRLQSR